MIEWLNSYLGQELRREKLTVLERGEGVEGIKENEKTKFVTLNEITVEFLLKKKGEFILIKYLRKMLKCLSNEKIPKN